jgi:hypothetical protein
MSIIRPLSIKLSALAAPDGFITASDLYGALGASSARPGTPRPSAQLPAPVDMALLPPAAAPPPGPVPALPAPPAAMPLPRIPPKAHVRRRANVDLEAQLVPSRYIDELETCHCLDTYSDLC